MINKIVFYTGPPRIFRTTSIGYLYEISQKYPVILLSENLDPETEGVIQDKKLFPQIEKIIPVYQYTTLKKKVLLKNHYLRKLAKDIIYQYRPDMIIADNDVYPFEKYLMNEAKKISAVNICFQGGYQISNVKEYNLFYDLVDNRPFTKIKKHFKHVLSFFGRSNFGLIEGNPGMKSANFLIVFSKRDYALYHKDGVPKRKLFILPHPLTTKTRAFFKRFLLPQKKNKKIITIMLEMQIGIRKKDLSLIDKKEIKETRLKAVHLINQVLKDYKIFIKPHPNISIKYLKDLKKDFGSISNIIIVNPVEPADKYIELSRIIIGVPPDSTTLFTASLQNPNKPIISLDFNHELLGDSYKNFKGVEYIDDWQEFKHILKLIKSNKYKKEKILRKEEKFSGSVELIEHIYQKAERLKKLKPSKQFDDTSNIKDTL